ncbi:hypothetical protein B0A52_05157 [Exophiala mesophila]|uniref:Xylanolytic transcriptional activator regulatory domain-containing protein n=1 Tax=Exophiala mesophila TaxID=212818 RepID=A0A438N425_EXOME|nr:hypothetical protein B0A52_05157 [Exophiala mesophila]
MSPLLEPPSQKIHPHKPHQQHQVRGDDDFGSVFPQTPQAASEGCLPPVPQTQVEMRSRDPHSSGPFQLPELSLPGQESSPQATPCAAFTPQSAPTERAPRASTATPTASHSAVSYLGDTGILKIFELDTRRIAESDPYTNPQSALSVDADLPPLELQQSFAETYFDYCWTWCPVFHADRFWSDLDVRPSRLLVNALALLGTQVRPPLIQHAKAADYYNRAKLLFYTDQENNPITCLQAIMLFYWWAPRGPSLVHKDAAWWWTGVAIKYAQQVGLHREPRKPEDVGGPAMQGQRRRIWWTLFARERLTGTCQGRPVTIDPADCNVREPSLEDFTPSEIEDGRADIFIQWVRLCAIVGRVGQHISRQSNPPSFPAPLAEELVQWVQNLPPRLRLPETSDRTRKFDRDILALHLPYLTIVTILHLSWSSQNPSQALPEAYAAAVLSASCTTRIFKDLLARGEIRFLGAIACWYVGVAIVALLHTQRLDQLAECGAEDIRTLKVALNELASLWPSTDIFVQGFDRLRVFENLGRTRPNKDSVNSHNNVARLAKDNVSTPLRDLDWYHGIDWHSFFPGVSTRTSSLATTLLEEKQGDLWGDTSWLGDPALQFQDLFNEPNIALDPSLENLSSLCWPAILSDGSVGFN